MAVELPDKAVLLNQIHIVEYLGEDAEIQQYAVCLTSDDSEMELERVLYLLEWCKAKQLAPMIAGIIAEDICEGCGEDDDSDDDYGN